MPVLRFHFLVAFAAFVALVTFRPHDEKVMRLDEVVEPTAMTCTIPCDYGDSLARVTLWNDTIKFNNALRWNMTAAKHAETVGRTRKDRRPGRRSLSAVSATSGGHDPCAEPMNGLLPGYIVNRESRGQCGAYNAGGCSGRGCIGWAQVDAGHFAARSPWNPNVPGTCYGLTYNACVNRLSGGGSNLSAWGG